MVHIQDRIIVSTESRRNGDTMKVGKVRNRIFVDKDKAELCFKAEFQALTDMDYNDPDKYLLRTVEDISNMDVTKCFVIAVGRPAIPSVIPLR
jgi:hypothetical protein